MYITKKTYVSHGSIFNEDVDLNWTTVDHYLDAHILIAQLWYLYSQLTVQPYAVLGIYIEKGGPHFELPRWK